MKHLGKVLGIVLFLGQFYSAHADSTEIDGNITASSLTVTGPVTMSSITVANNLIFSTGSATSFIVINSTITTAAINKILIPVGIGTADATQLSYHSSTIARDVGAPADYGVNSQLVVTGMTSPSKQMDIGFDTTNNFGYLQSEVQGTSYNQTIINPNGGSVAIRGTATNDNASSGFVGEWMGASFPSGMNVTTSGSFGNLASITLTPGDWDVTGVGTINHAGTTLTGNDEVALSLYSGNTTTDHVSGDNLLFLNSPSTVGFAVTQFAIPTWRVSISSTMPVYLKAISFYSGVAPVVSGRISARRVR